VYSAHEGDFLEAPMKRTFVLLVSAVVFSALAPTALGKGASEATLDGPGLSDPITFNASGDPVSGVPVWQIAEESGFYAAVFDESLASRVTEAPASELGPRYTMTYTMPGPSGNEDRIIQHLYPYALPSPVAFVARGQPYFGDRRTQGGWFVASQELKDLLVTAGLPETRPADGSNPSDTPWTVIAPLLVLAGIAFLGGIALVMTRRRPQAA
jgi:hypothetical protein